jgi:uncharacterized membrane protein (DUF4010 family)
MFCDGLYDNTATLYLRKISALYLNSRLAVCFLLVVCVVLLLVPESTFFRSVGGAVLECSPIAEDKNHQNIYEVSFIVILLALTSLTTHVIVQITGR